MHAQVDVQPVDEVVELIGRREEANVDLQGLVTKASNVVLYRSTLLQASQASEGVLALACGGEVVEECLLYLLPIGERLRVGSRQAVPLGGC